MEEPSLTYPRESNPRPPRPARRSELGPTLHRIVRERPGIHFRALAREADLHSAGQLRHHLDRLKRLGDIVELEDGRYKRFFSAAGMGAELRPGMARFARPLPRQIGKLLLARPMNRTELRRRLGCADSTLGYHLNRMMKVGDLDRLKTRSGCQYSLRDGDMVRRVLTAQASSGINPLATEDSDMLAAQLPQEPGTEPGADAPRVELQPAAGNRRMPDPPGPAPGAATAAPALTVAAAVAGVAPTVAASPAALAPPSDATDPAPGLQ